MLFYNVSWDILFASPFFHFVHFLCFTTCFIGELNVLEY